MAKKKSTVNQVTQTVISVTLRILFLVAVVVCLWMGAVKGFEFGYEIFNGSAVEKNPGKEVTIVIQEGDSTSKVGKELEKKGMIQSSLIFQIQGMFFKYDMKPGSYTLDASMTSREMLHIIDAGPQKEETK